MAWAARNLSPSRADLDRTGDFDKRVRGCCGDEALAEWLHEGAHRFPQHRHRLRAQRLGRRPGPLLQLPGVCRARDTVLLCTKSAHARRRYARATNARCRAVVALASSPRKLVKLASPSPRQPHDEPGDHECEALAHATAAPAPRVHIGDLTHDLRDRRADCAEGQESRKPPGRGDSTGRAVVDRARGSREI
jgi:hypothetical protein